MIRKSRLIDTILDDYSELEKHMYSEEIEEILGESSVSYNTDYKIEPENTSFWVIKEDFSVSMGFRGS